MDEDEEMEEDMEVDEEDEEDEEGVTHAPFGSFHLNS